MPRVPPRAYLPATLRHARESVRLTVAWPFSCQKYTRFSDSFQGWLTVAMGAKPAACGLLSPSGRRLRR